MKFIPITEEQSKDPVLIDAVAYVFLNSYSKVITEEELDYIDSYAEKVFKAKGTDEFINVTNNAFDNVTGNPDISIPSYFYFIRSLTRDNKVSITFADFPEFKELVANYGALTRNALSRSYEIERS